MTAIDILEETLVASAARTTSGSQVSAADYGPYDQLRAQLNVTAASGTTPNLAVVIEDSADGGVNWNTVGTFTAKTAAGRETISVSGFTGRRLRATWTITGTTPSFTFSVAIVAEP
jgi:hypothetical protein